MNISINNSLGNIPIFSATDYTNIRDHFNDIALSEFKKISSNQLEPTTQNGFYNLLNKLNNTIEDSDVKIQKFFNGDSSLVETVIKTHEVSNQIKLILEIRNKCIESLEKVMNMSV